MSEWTTVRLADVAGIRFSNVDKKSIPGEPHVRLCNYMDVYANDYIAANLPFMEATASQAEIERFRVEEGDVMLTKDSETPDDIGIPAVVVEEVPALVCGYHLALIKPRKDKVDPVYLAKQLGSKQTATYFSKLANGSTRYGLSSSAIANTAIPLAPLPQQRRIAEILSTLDEAIEQTEALIAKMQQVKAGLMHDLFTRGVTPDGRLRPTREQAPELYKESPLGWIPREWEVKPLGAFTQFDITYGIVQAGPHVENGVPYIRTGDMSGDSLARAELLCTSRRIADSYNRSEVRAGEIVCAIRATVGKVLIVPPDLHGANLTQGTARIAPNAKTDAAFLLWAIRDQRTQRVIAASIKGTTFSEITLGDLRQLPVAAPIKIDEQKLIGQRLDQCDHTVKAENNHLAKLRQQKHGLMHDLLTGRVRTTEGVTLT